MNHSSQFSAVFAFGLYFAISGVLLGCVHNGRTQTPAVPQIVFGSLPSNMRRGHSDFSGDIELYGAMYGWAGWIAGLEDDRPLWQLTGLDRHMQFQEGEPNGPRVKDVFFHYYLRQPWADKTLMPPHSAMSWSELDIRIKKAIDDMRARMKTHYFIITNFFIVS